MNSKSNSFISNNLVLNGNMEFQGNIRIDGKVTGKIQSQGTVTVGEEAQIDADIIAEDVVSSGKTKGSIFAEESVYLNQNGELVGNIKTKNLEIKLFDFEFIVFFLLKRT